MGTIKLEWWSHWPGLRAWCNRFWPVDGGTRKITGFVMTRLSFSIRNMVMAFVIDNMLEFKKKKRDTTFYCICIPVISIWSWVSANISLVSVRLSVIQSSRISRTLIVEIWHCVWCWWRVNIPIVLIYYLPVVLQYEYFRLNTKANFTYRNRVHLESKKCLNNK